MARRGAADVHVAVHAGRQRALGTCGDVDCRSSAAVRELAGKAARRRQVGDERPLVGRPGPAARCGVGDGSGEEELRAPGTAADGDDVACECGTGTIDRVVRPERSLVHADVAADDPETTRADVVLADEYVAGQIAAGTFTARDSGRVRQRDSEEEREWRTKSGHGSPWESDLAGREQYGVDHAADRRGEHVHGAGEVRLAQRRPRRTVEPDPLEG